MAISGSAKPAVKMWLEGKTLHVEDVGMMQGVQNDIATVAGLLVEGKTVYAQNYIPLKDGIKRTLAIYGIV